MAPDQATCTSDRDRFPGGSRSSARQRATDDNRAGTFTCGDLFAGTWTKLAWHLNEGAWLPAYLADRSFGGDEAAAMRYYAVCGGNYAAAWFGNPWWERAITA